MTLRPVLTAAAAAIVAVAGARPDEAPHAAPSPAAEALAAQLQCLACHAAPAPTEERLRPLGAPLLDGIGARATPQWLRFWLEGGHAAASGSRMPDLLHGLDAAQRAATSADLTQFLASLDGPFRAAPALDDAWRIEEGRLLAARLACAACHAEGEFAARRLSAKTDLPRLAAFLREPFATRPHGGMPDFRLSQAEAEALAAFLLREQHAVGPARTELRPGVRMRYHEYALEGPLPADLDAIEVGEPRREQIVERVGLPVERRPERFALRFEGWLALEAEEELLFGLQSDDGSRLSVDGALVVDNDGLHAPETREAKLRLGSGLHRVSVEMFEAEGGETLDSWIERDGRRRPLGAEDLSVLAPVYEPLGTEDFAMDPASAARGRARFKALGCAACHGGIGEPPEEGWAPAWEALDPQRGCLADVPPEHAPRYALDARQRAALRGLVGAAAELRAPPAPSQRVAADLERMRCVACHARGGSGPSAERIASFTGDGDLGDEGRVPPALDGVGAKLRPEALARVLAGESAARPYLHARMPRFAPAQVEGLADAFARADAAVRGDLPDFDPDLIDAGRRLAGTGGLNCIQCHPVGGRTAGGIQAMDLTRIAERLQPGWFAAWMENPLRLRRNTRMPVFFAGGRSAARGILDGDADRQIAALWSWLSLGASLPLPDGLSLAPGSYALDPADRPIYFGAFVKGGSPRVLNVGFPERVHLSFDCENVRLMQVWRGDFMDAEGTWHGRAGALESPGGSAVLALPAGPPFCRAPAGEPGPPGKAGGWRMLGHRRDAAGRPTFRYACGALRVEETLLPEYTREGAALRRRFVVEAPADQDWELRAALSARWLEQDGGWSSAEGLRIRVEDALAQVVALQPAEQELRVPLRPGSNAFALLLTW